MMTDLANITDRFNWYLKAAGIDAKKLSAITPINVRTCYRLMNGKARFTESRLESLKKAIPQIDLNYLITGV